MRFLVYCDLVVLCKEGEDKGGEQTQHPGPVKKTGDRSSTHNRIGDDNTPPRH